MNFLRRIKISKKVYRSNNKSMKKVVRVTREKLRDDEMKSMNYTRLIKGRLLSILISWAVMSQESDEIFKNLW